MTSESSTGRRGRQPGSEVGLRQLLDSNRVAPQELAPESSSEDAGTPAQRPSEWSGDSTPTRPIRTARRPAAPPHRPPAESGERWQRSSAPEPMAKSGMGLNAPIMKRVAIGVGALIGVAALAYVADLVISSGDVPRGVVVVLVAGDPVNGVG